MGEQFISWEPNTVIYKFGDKSDFAYLLKEGAVEILSENGTKVGYVMQRRCLESNLYC